MRSSVLGILGLALSAELYGQQPQQPLTWNVSLGAAAFVFPRYPGSDEYRVVPFPMVQVTFRNRVFLGPSTTGWGFALGAHAISTRRLRLTVELGAQDSRPTSRADALAGLENRDGVGTVGGSLSYRTGPFEGSVGIVRGLNDGAGVLGTARLSHYRSLGRRLMMTVSAGVALADAKQMRREFGISEIESIRRRALIAAGDTRLKPDDGNPYRPGGGLRQLGATISLMYALSPRWFLIGLGGLERLSDNVADSPLVRRREQLWTGIGLSHHL
jgi:outer membrane scaffolding protein for murein synthesis (MipA/OmpV family)